MRRIRKQTAVLLSMLFLTQMLFFGVTPEAASAASEAIYVAPGASGSGTKANPMDLETAIKTVSAGQIIYLLEGTYEYSHTIKIQEGNDGKEGAYKTLMAYPGAEVVLDFSEQPFGQRGVLLAASYWHIFGITIRGAGDNGMLLAGDYNRIEQCVFDGNKDSGLQISRDNKDYTSVKDWPSYNYILNCTSRNNADPGGENADGFAPKLTCGEGNVFDGCMAHNNVDDGWDCYAKDETGPIGRVTIINCIAFRNGQTENGTFTEDSDGNGFKLGGGGLGTPHLVVNCLAFENQNCGFTDNNNPSAISLINCTSFNNNLSTKKMDFNVYRCKDGYAVNLLAFNEGKSKNQLKNLSGSHIVYASGTKWYEITKHGVVNTSEKAYRGTQISKGLTAADFISAKAPVLGTDFHTYWREEDGSLDTRGFAMLTSTSAWADFATDGLAAGARFFAGAEFVTPETAEQIKNAAISGTAATVTPTPTATTAPKETLTPTPKPTATTAPKETLTPTPKPPATNIPTQGPIVSKAPGVTLTPTVIPDETIEEPLQYDEMPVVVACTVACVVIIGAAAGAIILIWKKK